MMTYAQSSEHSETWAPVESLSYEQALTELEEIVAMLESGNQTLDQSLELFERGQQLARRCADLLDKAELRIRQLSGNEVIDLNDL